MSQINKFRLHTDGSGISLKHCKYDQIQVLIKYSKVEEERMDRGRVIDRRLWL